MAQSKANGRDDLAAEDGIDIICKILDQNARDAEQTANTHCLLTSDDVSNPTSAKGRNE